MKIQTLHDLFIHELQDLYSAEQQIVEALTEMAQVASSKRLQQGFEKHIQETKEQAKRLEVIAKDLGFEIAGVTCKGMEGIVKEGKEVLKMKGEPDVIDAGLIGAAQRVEHYEIAGYGTAIAHAKQMKHTAAVKLLKKTLKEEEATDEKLSKQAEKSINVKADKRPM